MKKILFTCIILFALYLLNAELLNFNPHKSINNKYFTRENNDRPHYTIYHKDLIANIYENNEKEIIYENPKRISCIENTRTTLLNLHFNDTYPDFIIMNEDYCFHDFDATWLNPTTAEITVPDGIYNIYTIFYIESHFKFVINYNVNLFIGEYLEEIWIDHNDATNVLELNSCDVNGEPFDMTEKYFADFYFRISNGYDDYYISFGVDTNSMITSDIIENLEFEAGELKFNEENVYVTKYAPVQGITSSYSCSNQPTDYSSQQILLQIPEVDENKKIVITNTFWFIYMGAPLYISGYGLDNMFECPEDQWSTNLYMMNQDYEQCGSTASIFLGYYEDDRFQHIYDLAPFHCKDNKIGSFRNSTPIIVDYLSPNGEQLIFGQSPIYLEMFHAYYDNMLCPFFDPWGADNVRRDYDFHNSTFNLKDSSGNVITEGELTDMWNLNVPEDIYTLTVIDNNFNLAGLSGICRLTNYFNTALDLPNPPIINSFSILNENNKPINQLEYNENASLLFSVADMEYIDSLFTYFPVITDSVKVFCKLHEGEYWQEIETNLIDEFPTPGYKFGKVFSADLSELTTIDSVAYDVKLYSVDNEGNYAEFTLEPAFIVGDFDATPLTDNEIQSANLALSNYPNPFNPETTIQFNLNANYDIQIEIFNIEGQRVKSLVNEHFSKGEHLITWDGQDNTGKKVGSGLYFYKLIVDGNTEIVKRCILLK